jgi:hypothetical protein
MTYHSLEQEEGAILATYLKILKIVPGLNILTEQATADSSHALVELAVEVSSCSLLRNTPLIRLQA